MNRIYPLKFKPIIKEKIWGGTRLRAFLNKKNKSDKAGESWEISGYPGSVSRVSNGFLAGNTLEELIEVYMGDLVGEHVFERFGTLFPLLVKFIDANDMLSVQVHPDDDLASKIFNSYGKSEAWYVLEADPASEFIIGFNRKVDVDSFKNQVEKDSLMSILNTETAHKGDVFFLPAGRVHAIGKGILLAEIQQTSDATLRIYDYNRLDDKGNPRPLHLEQAIEAIDFNAYDQYKTSYAAVLNESVNLVRCEYFTMNHLWLNETYKVSYSELDSFVIFLCVEGNVRLHYHEKRSERLSKGETILIPAEIDTVTLVPEGEVKLLEVYVEGRSETDQMNGLLESLF